MNKFCWLKFSPASVFRGVRAGYNQPIKVKDGRTSTACLSKGDNADEFRLAGNLCELDFGDVRANFIEHGRITFLKRPPLEAVFAIPKGR
jgi:hypothetical protein